MIGKKHIFTFIVFLVFWEGSERLARSQANDRTGILHAQPQRIWSTQLTHPVQNAKNHAVFERDIAEKDTQNIFLLFFVFFFLC